MVRLSAPGGPGGSGVSGGYCSGVLVAPATVLTCAHFLAPRATNLGRVRCSFGAQGASARAAPRAVAAAYFAPGTDLALAYLDRPVEIEAGGFFGFGPAPRALDPTVTLGYGAKASVPQPRPGRFVAALPLAVSHELRTVVRPAGLVAAGAVKGDSGGPVLCGGKIVGVQSLILNPGGRNLHLATVSLLTKDVVERALRGRRYAVDT